MRIRSQLPTRWHLVSVHALLANRGHRDVGGHVQEHDLVHVVAGVGDVRHAALTVEFAVWVFGAFAVVVGVAFCILTHQILK